MLLNMSSNMLSNVHNMLIFVNICTAKLGKTFPVAGWGKAGNKANLSQLELELG